MNKQLLNVNWMKQGNLTQTILADTIERLSAESGETHLLTEKAFWRTITSLEFRYDIELFLTGQVFAGPDADIEVLEGSREFWEDFVQDAIRLTQYFLNK